MLSADHQNALIHSGLTSLEPLRKRALLAHLLLGLSIAAGGTAIFIALHASEQAMWLTVGGVAIIVTVAWLQANNTREDLRHRFDDWRRQVVRTIDPEATYSPYGFLAEGDFVAAEIASRYNNYSGGNLLQIGEFRASQLLVDDVTYRTEYETDSEGRRREAQRRVVTPVFHGLLLVGPAPLPTEGQVVLSSASRRGSHRIRVDHPDLSRAYNISSSPDAFCGHRTLTPRLMCAIADFRRQFRKAPRIAYQHRHIFVSVEEFPAIYAFGKYPGIFSAITPRRLSNTVTKCEASVRFVYSCATGLAPR